MALVGGIRFNVAFWKRHETKEGKPCDGVARVYVSHRTFATAAQSADPMSVFPDVVCPKCGIETAVSLEDWASEAKSATRNLREGVGDMARAALILSGKVTAKEMGAALGRAGAGARHHRIWAVVSRAMLRATDIARAEHGFDLARAVGIGEVTENEDSSV